MQRRYFEYLYNEICVAVNRRISRYDLWLLVWEGGGDPDDLTTQQAQYFIENNLTALLAEEGNPLTKRQQRRLARRILRFDPRFKTPEEWFSRALKGGQKAA